MKNIDKIVTGISEVIQFMINHDENQPNTEFCNNVDKLINLKAYLVSDDNTEKEALHIDSVMPRFSDEEDEDEFEEQEQEPDYYTCMCCGNVQGKGMTCNKCAGPTTESYY